MVLLANGRAGEVEEAAFRLELNNACLGMAEWLARDGEGATKLVRVRVAGAATDSEGARVARSVVDSPLIKTMAYGADPNVGRILMAVGKCVDCHIEPGSLSARLQECPSLLMDARTSSKRATFEAFSRGIPSRSRSTWAWGRRGSGPRM